jgi:hypothetical protein
MPSPVILNRRERKRVAVKGSLSLSRSHAVTSLGRSRGTAFFDAEAAEAAEVAEDCEKSKTKKDSKRSMVLRQARAVSESRDLCDLRQETIAAMLAVPQFNDGRSR